MVLSYFILRKLQEIHSNKYMYLKCARFAYCVSMARGIDVSFPKLL